MASAIDCVVVGYHEMPLLDLLDQTKASRDRSGGYRHLIRNSVVVAGQRVSYFDLFNTVVGGGRHGRYHVAHLPSLGVCYLVDFLRKRGLTAELVNFYTDEQDRLHELLARRPRAVAITTTFYFSSEPVQAIVRVVRERSPETAIVVGGPHIFNICSDHRPNVRDVLLEEIGADIYVFDSQGEMTLARVCAELRQPDPDLSRIPNVIVRQPDGEFAGGPREIENNDLNTSVDWTSFEPSFLLPTIQMRTARSCAYKCAFCRYPIMAGDLDLASLDTIERELDTVAALGATHLLFIDDTFNIPLKRFKEICRLMIRRRYGFKWFSYFRCANADMESFDLLAEAGCTGVFLGIESADDGVLKVMNKVATAAKYQRGIAELNARGVITYASFIVGHPSETDASAERTLAFIDEARPTFYGLELFFFDPKVPIAARAGEFGVKGAGYAWKHQTMDWRRAAEFVERGYREITHSIPLPLASFDIWSPRLPARTRLHTRGTDRVPARRGAHARARARRR